MDMVLTVPEDVISLIESLASSHGVSPAQVMITAVRQLADHDQHIDTAVGVDVAPVISGVSAPSDAAFRSLVSDVIAEHRDILDDLAS
jgi:hypothetical protein